MLSGKGSGDSAVRVITNGIDPHKMCQVEADLERTMKEVKKHTEEIVDIKDVKHQNKF
jgi:hypothetical protein